MNFIFGLLRCRCFSLVWCPVAMFSNSPFYTDWSKMAIQQIYFRTIGSYMLSALCSIVPKMRSYSGLYLHFFTMHSIRIMHIKLYKRNVCSIKASFSYRLQLQYKYKRKHKHAIANHVNEPTVQDQTTLAAEDFLHLACPKANSCLAACLLTRCLGASGPEHCTDDVRQSRASPQ